MQVLAFRSVLQAWWGYSVLQGLEPSLKKVRLPQNMRLLQELVRCKNSCQLYKSIIQIQKLRRAESKETCRVPKMMPCSIKVRRDWRLEVGYWLQEVIMWFLWFFMVLLIYCYVCLCALFISSFDLMWRAAMIWGWFQSKIMSWPSRESTVAALRPSWGQGQAATFQQVAAHHPDLDRFLMFIQVPGFKRFNLHGFKVLCFFISQKAFKFMILIY